MPLVNAHAQRIRSILVTEDVSSPWHFRELHLFPRVIFAVGAVLFVVSLVANHFARSVLGLAVVFTAVAYNLAFDAYINRNREGYTPKDKTEWRFLVVHSIASFLLALLFWFVFLWLARERFGSF
jgi:hypothetical protein